MSPTLLKVIGAAIGMAAAVTLVETRSKPALQPPDGPILSEYGGALREIVIQYVAGDTIAFPVYRDFLPQLASDVIVDVVCPDQQAFDEFKRRLGDVSCELRAIPVGHDLTVWSRDRWLALQPRESSDRVTLLAPTEEEGAATWPQREGDSKIAIDIARALPQSVTARRLPLYFDAGDLLADDRTVFVAPMVLPKNLTKTISSADELKQTLTRALSRKIVLLDQAPQHHLGMYMMAVGERTMLVGDPSRGKPLYDGSFPPLPGSPDFSDAMQARFDAVASQAQSEGYRVIRIPTLVSPDQKTFLTYVNVITEQRRKEKFVYLPTYQGATPLNQAAAQVWRDLGFTVHPVDCTSSYPFLGNLHCLVNVLRRAN
jgi:hypothetical protein